MLPFRNTCAIFGLCLLSLGNVAAAAAVGDVSMTLGEARAAFPDCAVRTCCELEYSRDGELTYLHNQRSGLVSPLAQSICTLTDLSCICNDQKFSEATGACVLSSCTVKEAYSMGIYVYMSKIGEWRDNADPK
jgi:hypothetical protein